MEQLTPPIKRQKGSVLLMSLMVVLVFGFSGFFVMEMATTGMHSSHNEWRSMEVYHAAYGELEAQLEFIENNPDVLGTVMSMGINTPLDLTALFDDANTNRDIVTVATLIFVGETPPPSGFSIGDFRGLMFEINCVATFNDVGARSSQTLRVTHTAPRI